MAGYVIALYGEPVDREAFDAYYDAVHVPIAATIPGRRGGGVSSGPALMPDGARVFHRVGVLVFDDLAAAREALATPEGQATAADATPDGKRLVVCTYDSLWLFDIDDPNQPLRGNVAWLPFTGPEEVEAACFADDQTILVADEGTGRLFEVPIDRFVPVRRADRPNSVRK